MTGFGASPTRSLFGNPAADPYEAAQARGFFISPEGRVVYSPPKAAQPHPPPTSSNIFRLSSSSEAHASPAVKTEKSSPSMSVSNPVPCHTHQCPPSGCSCAGFTWTGAATGTGERPCQGLFGETPKQPSAKPGPSLFGGFGATPQQRSTQPTPSLSLFGSFGATPQQQSTQPAPSFFGGFGAAPAPRTSSEGGASLLGSTVPRNSANTSSLFANLGGQASNPRVRGLFDNFYSGELSDRVDTRATNPPTAVPSLFGFQTTKPTQTTPSIRVAEDQAVNFGADILTITVGEGERSQIFSIHANSLTARSAYFKNALLQDPDQKTFNFPHIDPRAFALYFQLIYTGRLPSKPNDAKDEYTLLCKLYILAREFTDIAAQNASLDAIIAKASESGEIPASEHIWVIYKGTDGPCGARKMMLDFYTYEATGEWMKAQGEDARGFPPNFLGELAMRLVQLRKAPEGRMGGRAGEYHEV